MNNINHQTPSPATKETINGASPLTKFLNGIYPLSQQAVQYLQKHTHPVQVNKGKYLLKAGQTTECFHFIHKGVVRGFMKEEGREITTWINEENEIVGTIRGLGLPAQASQEYIQVIENATLIVFPYQCIEYLYTHFPESHIIARIILEESYRAAEERAYIARIPSAEKRYLRFLSTHPQLVERISLKYIASYLNMTQETLSRIRTMELKKIAE